MMPNSFALRSNIAGRFDISQTDERIKSNIQRIPARRQRLNKYGDSLQINSVDKERIDALEELKKTLALQRRKFPFKRQLLSDKENQLLLSGESGKLTNPQLLIRPEPWHNLHCHADCDKYRLMKNGFVSFGWISSAHGIRGEVTVRIPLNNPVDGDEISTMAFLKKPSRPNPVAVPVVKYRQISDEFCIMQFANILNRNDALMLRNFVIFNRKQLTLKTGEYFVKDLLELPCYLSPHSVYKRGNSIFSKELSNGEEILLGFVSYIYSPYEYCQKRVTHMADPLLQVQEYNSDIEYYIPFHNKFVKVDLEHKRITLRPPAGCLELAVSAQTTQRKRNYWRDEYLFLPHIHPNLMQQDVNFPIPADQFSLRHIIRSPNSKSPVA